MSWTEIIASVVLVVLFFGLFRGSSRSPRIWSGETPEEQGRRNTRTDINYQGWERWQGDRSDKGW